LPSAYFRVSRVSLAGVTKPLGDVCTKLGALTDPNFDALEKLDLSGTPLGDSDLQALAALTALTELSLGGTQVSDAGLTSLKGLKKLRRLVLDGTALRGLELANNLKELVDLTELRLGCATLTDVVAKQLGELKTLKRLVVLSLAGSSIGDETLKQLHGLTGLGELDLTGAPFVSAAGVAALRKALPKCRILGAPD
jgi:Leucine-rich repeat (LRR) protein